MTVSPSMTTRPATRLLMALMLVLGLSGGIAATSAPSAEALVSATTARTALSQAVAKRGSPYQYGAMGPYRFDCSGLTKWSYARVHKYIPRTAGQQYNATMRVSPASRRPGDLVFFITRGKVTHVGIYAGANMIWHAPRTGSYVKRQTIWASFPAIRYGRVR
jgi:cell wall-associated NlpC family hydrolase